MPIVIIENVKNGPSNVSANLLTSQINSNASNTLSDGKSSVDASQIIDATLNQPAIYASSKKVNETSASTFSSSSTTSTNSSNVSETGEDEDEEDIELIFDMDNNSLKEVNNLQIESASIRNEEQISLIEQTEVRLNETLKQDVYSHSREAIITQPNEKNDAGQDDDDEDNIIFDLDSKRVIKNENAVDMYAPTHSKSKITITKVVKK